MGIKLHYGTKVISLSDKTTKFLSNDDQRLLLDGKFVIETGIKPTEDEKIRKAYFVGVLWELFKKNFSESSNNDLYAGILFAYPVFMKTRQLQNVLTEYFELKEKHDVFTAD